MKITINTRKYWEELEPFGVVTPYQGHITGHIITNPMDFKGIVDNVYIFTDQKLERNDFLIEV